MPLRARVLHARPFGWHKPSTSGMSFGRLDLIIDARRRRRAEQSRWKVAKPDSLRELAYVVRVRSVSKDRP